MNHMSEITTDFSWALEQLKEREVMYRKGWNGKGLFVKAQFPDENSKMTEPYLFISAVSLEGGLVPWVPSQMDMFAEDWDVYGLND